MIIRVVLREAGHEGSFRQEWMDGFTVGVQYRDLRSPPPQDDTEVSFSVIWAEFRSGSRMRVGRGHT